MLEVIDFLERLAPFSTPDLLVRDPRPQLVADRAPEIARARTPARPPVSAGGDDDEAPVPAQAPPAKPGGFDAYEALRSSLGQD
jgi:nitrous oxidase accessory protein